MANKIVRLNNGTDKVLPLNAFGFNLVKGTSTTFPAMTGQGDMYLIIAKRNSGSTEDLSAYVLSLGTENRYIVSPINENSLMPLSISVSENVVTITNNAIYYAWIRILPLFV